MKPVKKYKLSRRLGIPIHEKAQSEKFSLREARRKGIRVTKHPRTLTDYGRQFLEKQKVRFSYGISERQFRRYVKMASVTRGSAPELLYQKLESRLDNTVYRLGFARTRRAARQLVAHGHIFVNGRRVRIPSYEVGKGDSVSVRKESREKKVFQNFEEYAEHRAPAWLLPNEKSLEGSVIGIPTLEESREVFDLSSVIEFYSR